MNRIVTSANATLILMCENLFPQGVKLEQFSTDAMISQSDETYAETRMGVDGNLVMGYVDQAKTVTITLEPSSPSIRYLDLLVRATRANKRVYDCTLLVNLPSVGKTITYSHGCLKQGKLMADANQTLQPIQYQFDFERVA